MNNIKFKQGELVEILELESLEGVNIETYNRIRAGKKFILGNFKLVDGKARWELPSTLTVLSFNEGEAKFHTFIPENAIKHAE